MDEDLGLCNELLFGSRQSKMRASPLLLSTAESPASLYPVRTRTLNRSVCIDHDTFQTPAQQRFLPKSGVLLWLDGFNDATKRWVGQF